MVGANRLFQYSQVDAWLTAREAAAEAKTDAEEVQARWPAVLPTTMTWLAGHARPRRRPCAERLTRKPHQRMEGQPRSRSRQRPRSLAWDNRMAERHHAASRRQTEVAEADSDKAARWP